MDPGVTTSPVAQEAARLIAALQDWYAGATEDAPLATGARECRLCPVCRLLRGLGAVRPEAAEHLVTAIDELTAALRSVVEGTQPSRPRHDSLQHVPLDE